MRDLPTHDLRDGCHSKMRPVFCALRVYPDLNPVVLASVLVEHRVMVLTTGNAVTNKKSRNAADQQPAIASPWVRSIDRDQERAIKRDAVLRTAARLFNEHGYHATSLAMIAARLKVTKPTLYYYVQNKEEILFECVRLGLDLLRSAISDVSAKGGSGLDKLNAAMFAYGLVVTQDFGMCLIRVGEDPLPQESRNELRRRKAELDREFRMLVAQGVAEGYLEPCDPKLAAFTLAGALSWIGRWYDPMGPLAADEAVRQVTHVLLGGLLRRESTAPIAAQTQPAKAKATTKKLKPAAPHR